MRSKVTVIMNSILRESVLKRLPFFWRMSSNHFLIGSFIKGSTRKFHLEMKQIWAIKGHSINRWLKDSGSHLQKKQRMLETTKRELSLTELGRASLIIFQNKSLCLLWILAFQSFFQGKEEWPEAGNNGNYQWDKHFFINFINLYNIRLKIKVTKEVKGTESWEASQTKEWDAEWTVESQV